MGYQPGSGIQRDLGADHLVRACFNFKFRLYLFLFCLAANFLLAIPASAQSWDSSPARNDVLAAIANSRPNQICCIRAAENLLEEQQFQPANSTTPATPDWDGLKQDTWYFMGAQLASLAALYVLPESISGWSDEQKEDFSFSKWKKNVSNPQIDEDDFVINYILHPYWGAAYYVRARERGYGQLNSFWYSVFLSTFYEAGAEALFEQPSIQDLIVTPVFGAWLGEYFMGLRSDIRNRTKERGYRSGRDNWLWYLTDPLDLVNVSINRLFGPQAELSFSPLIGTVNQNSGNGMESPNRPLQTLTMQQKLLWAGHSKGERQRSAGFRFTISW